MTTMTIGVDLHKRESRLCLLAEDGTTTEHRITQLRRGQRASHRSANRRLSSSSSRARTTHETTTTSARRA